MNFWENMKKAKEHYDKGEFFKAASHFFEAFSEWNPDPLKCSSCGCENLNPGGSWTDIIALLARLWSLDPALLVGATINNLRYHLSDKRKTEGKTFKCKNCNLYMMQCQKCGRLFPISKSWLTKIRECPRCECIMVDIM